MPPGRFKLLRWGAYGAALLSIAAAAAAVIWRDDILRTQLDPKEPFQTYQPPPAPDYARRDAWALLPSDPVRWTGEDGPADIFFIHPTTYDGGEEWNAPIGEPGAERLLQRTMIPNYAGPFQRVGRVFAPRYRQASLYSLLTNRDDAREARRFAYGDVRAAFDHFRTRFNRGRPIVIVGVEQGAQLAERLMREVTADEALRRRLATVYAIEGVILAQAHGPGSALPACTGRNQPRCLVAWASAPAGDEEAANRLLQRAYVAEGDVLRPLAGRAAVCVNPLTGAAATAAAARQNLGAASASGVEWGVRPAFLPQQVSAECRGGVLRVSRPSSPGMRLSAAWADSKKVPPYNVFYADLEADASARVAALLGRADLPRSAPSIDAVQEVRDVPISRAP